MSRSAQPPRGHGSRPQTRRAASCGAAAVGFNTGPEQPSAPLKAAIGDLAHSIHYISFQEIRRVMFRGEQPRVGREVQRSAAAVRFGITSPHPRDPLRVSSPQDQAERVPRHPLGGPGLWKEPQILLGSSEVGGIFKVSPDILPAIAQDRFPSPLFLPRPTDHI
jgi:hypothetical protein